MLTPLPVITNWPVLSNVAPKPWLCSAVAILAITAPLESVAEILMNELICVELEGLANAAGAVLPSESMNVQDVVPLPKVIVSLAAGAVALVKVSPTAAAETVSPFKPRPVVSDAVTVAPLLGSLFEAVIVEPATLLTTDTEEFVAPTPVPVVAIKFTPLKVALWAN